MKRYCILIFLAVSLCVPAANAFEMICGNFITCDPDTDDVGYRSDGASSATTDTTQSIACNLFTPDCSGPLNTAYLRHYDTTDDNAKMAVYLDDGDDAPDSGDTLVANSGVINGTATATWYSSAMTTTPTVSTSSKYWVCRIREDYWDYYYDSGLTTYYMACPGCYASIPGDLGGTWSTISNRKAAMYVTIGD